jgi:hypothetical protein
MLPDVPYGATAVRPNWPDLPESLREAISERLGGPIVTARTAGGGFTRAFAAALTTKDGFRAFIKAAPLREPTAEWYARESSITAALPEAVAAPRPRWTMVHSGYFTLCLDFVDGHVPALPWHAAELEAAVTTWTTAASTLATPPFPGLPRLPDITRHEMSVWSSGALPSDQLSQLVALPERTTYEPATLSSPTAPDPTTANPTTASPTTPGPTASEPTALPQPAAFPQPTALPPPAALPPLATPSEPPAFANPAVFAEPAVLAELVALERLLPDAVAGSGMLHGDLRIDNVLIDRAGKAWLCDWTWPCLGAPWFDTVTLLVTAFGAYASQAEVNRFLTDAPPEGVDAALAGLAGYWLARAAGPASSASPHSRQHQAYSGRAALSWLSARRGWA